VGAGSWAWTGRPSRQFDQVAKTYGVVEGDKKMLRAHSSSTRMGRVRTIYREEGADLETVIEADFEASKTAVRPASDVK